MRDHAAIPRAASARLPILKIAMRVMRQGYKQKLVTSEGEACHYFFATFSGMAAAAQKTG